MYVDVNLHMWLYNIDTKVSNERPESVFKLALAKLDRDRSSKIKSLKNKLCNVQGSTGSLNRSPSIESMDTETDNITANLSQEDIYIYI